MASRQDSRPTAAWIDIPGPNIGGLIHGVEAPTFHARTSRLAVAADITNRREHMRTLKAWTSVAVVALVLAAHAAGGSPGRRDVVRGRIAHHSRREHRSRAQRRAAGDGHGDRHDVPMGHRLLRRPRWECLVGNDRQLVRRIPAPGRACMGAGRSRRERTVVHVGRGPTTLSGTGEVVFAANDDLFPDNTGNFVVSYECRPGWGHGDDNHLHCGPPQTEQKDPPRR